MDVTDRIPVPGAGGQELGQMAAQRRAALALCPLHPVRGLEELIGARAFTDAAIAILCEALPDCGFKLVIPPRRAGLVEAYASLWRRGATRAVAHRGATPAMALLQAVESEWMQERNANALADCAHCRGRGWYVTAAGSKEFCRHQIS